MVSGSRQRMMREMVEESLSGTWAGMAQGDLAPEMMSSTKLSTVSRGSEEDMPQMMTLVSPGLCPPPCCEGRPRLTHEFGVETDPTALPYHLWARYKAHCHGKEEGATSSPMG